VEGGKGREKEGNRAPFLPHLLSRERQEVILLTILGIHWTKKKRPVITAGLHKPRSFVLKKKKKQGSSSLCPRGKGRVTSSYCPPIARPCGRGVKENENFLLRSFGKKREKKEGNTPFLPLSTWQERKKKARPSILSSVGQPWKIGKEKKKGAPRPCPLRRINLGRKETNSFFLFQLTGKKERFRRPRMYRKMISQQGEKEGKKRRRDDVYEQD